MSRLSSRRWWKDALDTLKDRLRTPEASTREDGGGFAGPGASVSSVVAAGMEGCVAARQPTARVAATVTESRTARREDELTYRSPEKNSI